MSNYQNNLNHWRHQAREEEDRKARMNMGIGNFLAEISSSESEEYQTRDPGYEPTQSVKDYSQPLYCKICHITGSPRLSKCNLVSSETNLGTFLTLLAVAAKTFFEVELVPVLTSS